MNSMLAVFAKELQDVLRDRRTLLAMILIPIVLYPAMFIISLQALSQEIADRAASQYLVLLPDPELAARVQQLIGETSLRARQQADGDGDAAATAFMPIFPRENDESGRSSALQSFSLANFELLPFPDGLDKARLAVVRGDAHAALWPDHPGGNASQPAEPMPPTWTLLYDPSNVRSASAAAALRSLLERARQHHIESAIVSAGIAQADLIPFQIQTLSVADPAKVGGAALAAFLPFILIIMTITGAIYPAIDLTVGERERGTLETLLTAPTSTTALVLGKFLVVFAVAVITAALNLASMGATFYFTGLADVLPANSDFSFPLNALPLVLAAMLPTAALFSAIMLATCCFARSFKEAQNYMMPVIVAALLPAIIITTRQSIQFTPFVAILPIANVVVLTRELFLQNYNLPLIALAMGSTALYAAAALALAVRLFGQEAILFADAVSYRSLLSRRHFAPGTWPTLTVAVSILALAFPAFIYTQTALARSEMPNAIPVSIICTMVLIFAAPPILAAWYFRFSFADTFALRAPPLSALAAAVGVALVSVPVAYIVAEAVVRFTGMQFSLKQLDPLLEALGGLSLPTMLLLLALLPAVCEEILFRGLLLSALRRHLPAGVAIVLSSAAFALFHVDPVRLAPTFLLGCVLATLVVVSGSIYPAILLHLLHNGTAVTLTRMSSATEPPDLHAWMLLASGPALLLITPLVLSQLRRARARCPERVSPADAARGPNPHGPSDPATPASGNPRE